MQPSPLNVANGLTMARIACTPFVVLAALATPEGSILVGAFFALLALSDVADGYLARSRHLVTTLGKLLDPMADKLLIGGALLALVATERLPLAIALVILSRELMVSALRHVAYREGIVISAGPLGKAKMGLQVAMVLALLAFGYSDAAWLQLLILATVAMTLWSGLSYFASLPRARALRPDASA
ncbi:MAG: CDP-diacylglycerol--glycerol-3-phosphate 3-phosphatidyltransferase [Actinomycetota bacterium]|nr:CDP-diacylglycerol--glycerol-3-phosphate 3-phosphatidyltransferase [Actinomycetota bacterium]